MGELQQTGEATPSGRMLDRQGRLPGSPLRRALIVSVAGCLLSVAGSSSRLISALELLRILAVMMMFVVLEQMMTDRKVLKQTLLALYLSTLFPLAFTAFGFLIGQPRVEEKGDLTRIVGPFDQSNEFGRYLMLVIIFGIAVYPHLQRKLQRPLAGILALSPVALGPTGRANVHPRNLRPWRCGGISRVRDRVRGGQPVGQPSLERRGSLVPRHLCGGDTFAAAASTIIQPRKQRPAPASQPTWDPSPRMAGTSMTGFRGGFRGDR